MNYFYFLAGIILFIGTATDIIKTTLSAKGGGPITNLISRGVWYLLFIVSGKRGTSTLLSYSGPVMLATVLFFWVTALWCSLFLALYSDPGSVVNSTTMAATDPLEKLYYAGFTLSTLGVGDYIVTSNLWRIITSIAAFSGLAFITASITYFVPVLSAVELQGKLSLYISSLGKTPQDILTSSWNGKDFSAFSDHISPISQMLMQHVMHHYSYPVVHYFHKNKRKFAVIAAIVQLTEVYNLLRLAIPPHAGVEKLKMSILQTSLNAYLEMVKREFIHDTAPTSSAPFPNLTLLQESGIPLHQQEIIAHSFETEIKELRDLLTLMLEKDGWSWQDIYNPETNEEDEIC